MNDLKEPEYLQQLKDKYGNHLRWLGTKNVKLINDNLSKAYQNKNSVEKVLKFMVEHNISYQSELNIIVLVNGNLNKVLIK
jgi:hypothetical protein